MIKWILPELTRFHAKEQPIETTQKIQVSMFVDPGTDSLVIAMRNPNTAGDWKNIVGFTRDGYLKLFPSSADYIGGFHVNYDGSIQVKQECAE